MPRIIHNTFVRTLKFSNGIVAKLSPGNCMWFTCPYCVGIGLAGDLRCDCGCQKRTDCRFPGKKGVTTFLMSNVNKRCKKFATKVVTKSEISLNVTSPAMMSITSTVPTPAAST